jgi:hypothetical protein
MAVLDFLRPRPRVGAIVLVAVPLAVVAASGATIAVVAALLYKPARKYLREGVKAAALGVDRKLDRDAMEQSIQNMIDGKGAFGGPPAAAMQDRRVITGGNFPPAPPARATTREEEERLSRPADAQPDRSKNGAAGASPTDGT